MINTIKFSRVDQELIDRVRKREMDILDEVDVYKRLMDRYKLTFPDIAKTLKREDQTVVYYARLLDAPETLKKAVRSGKLQISVLQWLMTISDPAERLRLGFAAIEDQMSYRQFIDYLRTQEQYASLAVSPNQTDPNFDAAIETLSQYYRLPVSLEWDGVQSGTIRLHFDSLPDFHNLYLLLLHGVRAEDIPDCE